VRTLANPLITGETSAEEAMTDWIAATRDQRPRCPPYVRLRDEPDAGGIVGDARGASIALAALAGLANANGTS
jgi:hypothetical protein